MARTSLKKLLRQVYQLLGVKGIKTNPDGRAGGEVQSHAKEHATDVCVPHRLGLEQMAAIPAVRLSGGATGVDRFLAL